MNNNTLKVGAGGIVYATSDGNVIRLDIYVNGKEPGEHIELYDHQALQLYERLGKALEDMKKKTPMT